VDATHAILLLEVVVFHYFVSLFFKLGEKYKIVEEFITIIIKTICNVHKVNG